MCSDHTRPSASFTAVNTTATAEMGTFLQSLVANGGVHRVGDETTAEDAG